MSGWSKKECSLKAMGGPYRAGSSVKREGLKMWSMGHTNGSVRREAPGALHLSSGLLYHEGHHTHQPRVSLGDDHLQGAPALQRKCRPLRRRCLEWSHAIICYRKILHKCTGLTRICRRSRPAVASPAYD